MNYYTSIYLTQNKYNIIHCLFHFLPVAVVVLINFDYDDLNKSIHTAWPQSTRSPFLSDLVVTDVMSTKGLAPAATQVPRDWRRVERMN